MSWIKIIAVNLLVLFALLGFANYGTVGLSKIAGYFSSSPSIATKQIKSLTDIEWARNHAREFREVRSKYEDYILWRREEFVGKTLNIDKNGLRKTSAPPQSNGKTIWMFGGSTVFGTGTSDEGTIPSKMASLFNYEVLNFGVPGYTTRQEVNLLMNHLSLREKPDFVVFYDGINDVVTRCRMHPDTFGSTREFQIQDRMKLKPDSWAWQFQTPTTIGQRFIPKKVLNLFTIQRKPEVKSPGCDKNASHARWAAKSMVDNLLYAKAISEATGIKFIALLQPVSFFSKTRKDHIPPRPRTRRNYEAVYPLIREESQRRGLNIYDVTDVFDVDEYLYYDFMHVTEQGNALMAKRIVEILTSQ